jgi:hypothetical protein
MMQLWQKLAIGRSVDSSLPSDGICRFGEVPAAPALRHELVSTQPEVEKRAAGGQFSPALWISCFDAFSSREPVSTAPENALAGC